MTLQRLKFTALFGTAFLVLILDQITKFLVRTNPELHRVEVIEGWLALNFTKNPGMALGMDWLSTPAISVVAILATVGILVYILLTIEKANLAYLTCMGLILGGAIGNITDRIFMGIIGGYGGVLHGHVVDFIHFTLHIGEWPVFPYIFNVADIAISTSIIVMLLFHKKIMPVEHTEKTEEETQGQETSENNGESVATESDQSETDRELSSK